MKKVFLTIGIAIVSIAIIITGVLFIKGKTYKVQNPIATIQIEGYEKSIKIELDPQSAPNAVANFIKLANSGFYTNFKMSNIMEYPQNDYVYGIKGDFIANGYDTNLIKHKKGVITMERDDYSYFGYKEEGYNSANCNFCILTQDIDNYNGYYAGFGNVVEGMDVLDAIAATRVEVSEDNKDSNDETKKDDSVNTITIASITVDTFGVDYGVPEVVNYEENIEKVNKIYNQYFGGSSNGSLTVEE